MNFTNFIRFRFGTDRFANEKNSSITTTVLRILFRILLISSTIPFHPIRRAAPPETGHPSGNPAFRPVHCMPAER